VIARNHAVIAHQRDEAGDIAACIVRDGAIRLDARGIEPIGLFQAAGSLGGTPQ
jgi:hypothetical protein